MRRGRPRYPELLTPREQEVLALLREGLTNQEIADRLGISLYAARYHVSEILSKLGVTSREEAAVWQPETPERRRGLPGLLATPLAKLGVGSALKLAAAGALGVAAIGLALLVLGVLATGLPEAPEPSTDLGKLVYVNNGDIWTLTLPNGTPVRLTIDGRNHAPSWSPSGDWLLFEKPVERGAADLWVMLADGSEARRLDAAAAQWSPSADLLAYRTLDGKTRVEAADGAGRIDLLPAADHGFDRQTGFFAWSPDGVWLAVTAEARDDRPFPAAYAGLWAVRTDGSEARELIALREAQYGLLVAGWTPDGEHVIYSADPSFSASYIADGLQWDVVALDLIGGPLDSGVGPEAVIDNERRILRYEDYVDISTDGRMVAVRGGGRDSYLGKSIALVDAGSGLSFTDLTDQDEVAATSPDWSPDASTIAYVVQPLGQGIDPDGVSQRRIWLMDADGGNQRRLNDTEVRQERPQWSPDGRYVLYVRPTGDVQAPGAAELWLHDLTDGSEMRVLGGIEYTTDSIETNIGYYGYYDWGRLFDWWEP